MAWVHLNTGSGDLVCFILNDLLNRELIRLNFKFETPSISDSKQEPQVEIPAQEEEEVISDASEESIENDYMTQSIILYNKKFNVFNNL